MTQPQLICSHLTKRFGDTIVVNDLSFELQAGECLGVIGPNGAGKTTTFRMCLGLSTADSGNISVFGMPMPQETLAIKARLGVVSQFDTLDPDFTCSENLMVYGRYFGMDRADIDARIEPLLEFAALSHKANAKPGELSGGMKRRMLVAQALVHKPPVIVLDEPTAGVDVELRQTLWQFIAKLNKLGHTVLLTTHYLEEAEALCQRIAMLKNGKVVALDRTDELLKAASSNVLRFKLDAALPPALAAKARVTGRIVQLPAHDALEIERHLAALREAGLNAEDVEIRKADLEDVFLDVMHANTVQETV